MSKILKITFEDGREIEADYNPLHFEIGNWKFKKWEEENIIPNLLMDLEEYAMREFDLIKESDQKEIEDFSDFAILQQVRIRHLSVGEYKIQNPNITNQSFVSRFTEIINRGNDAEIDNALTMLEKNYRIK